MTLLADQPRPSSAAYAGRDRPGLRDVPQVRLGATQVVLVGLVTALHVARVGVGPGLAVVAVAVAVAVVAAALSVGHALAAAATAWAWLTGFVVHTGAQDGRLTLAAPDLHRLVVLLTVALVTTVIFRLSLRCSSPSRHP